MEDTNKLYRTISELKPWDKNPRIVKKEDLARLKKQLIKLGQYKPLLILADGTVIGGNMRFRAMQSLNWDKAWVSVITPKDDDELLEYALSDNDQVGEYDQQALAELVQNTQIELTAYKISVHDVSLKEVLEQFAPTADGEEGGGAGGESEEITCPECGAKFTK